MPLFWMKYRHPDGRYAGAMMVESRSLVVARMQATVFGLDYGLDFMSGHEIGAANAERIPASMIDRLLDESDLDRLRRKLLAKKPRPPLLPLTAAGNANGDKLGGIGRFTQRHTWHEIDDLYDLTGAARNLQPHYNIAPTDPVEVVRSGADGAELVSMRWGLVPYWWRRPLKQLPVTFTAPAESIIDKPVFRDAFKRHRCIIPASGYYEWLKRPDGRQPYFISVADGGVLSFAGLWDRWKNLKTGESVVSCTIIVTDANALMRPIHDRMPVVLDKADIGPWLKGVAGMELLRPAAEDRLRMWPVSRRVNTTGSGDDDPTLLDEVAAGI